MAATALAVAKAALIAPFVRADPASIPRDEVTAFHNCLDAATDRCSPTNIQKCRAWLSRNATSANRVSAVGKYLGLLSASFPVAEELERRRTSGQPSAKRRRLHILYLVNDWLHAAHHHQYDGMLGGGAVGECLQPHLVNLIALAGTCDLKQHKKLQRRMTELLDEWQRQEYYNTEFIETLRAATVEAAHSPLQESETDTGNKRSIDSTVPFNLPTQHGDTSTPWYDLPAANMLPHITPNSAYPIDAELVKPIRFNPGPADSSLVALVQDLIKESDIIYGEDEVLAEEAELDYDELGQKVLRSKDGKDISYGDTYYGWSKEFCERMKRRQKEGLPDDKPHQGRDRSTSRRRYSSSLSRSPSRSRSRRPGFRRPSRSSSPSRSRSPLRRSHNSRSHPNPPGRNHGHDRDRSYPPPAPIPTYPTHQIPPPQPPPMRAPPNLIPPPPPLDASMMLPPEVIQMMVTQGLPPPHPPLQGMPGPPGMVAPPPRPPNWHGPWPPPPPPPPPGSVSGFGQYPYHPPPPPPPGGWQPPGQAR